MSNKVFHIERVSDSEQQHQYRATIIEDHSVFDGHFPESPVVPGVCTMEMIKDCLSDALARSVRYSYIKECKFLAAIIPTQHKTLDVNITLKQDEQQMNVTAEVTCSQVKMMKLKATLSND